MSVAETTILRWPTLQVGVLRRRHFSLTRSIAQYHRFMRFLRESFEIFYLLLKRYSVVALYNSIFMGSCCAAAATTIIVYDWLNSLTREVKLFWKGSPSGARVLYFLSRYIRFFGAVSSVLAMFDLSNEACMTVSIMSVIFSALPSLIWAAFSALRVYALTKNRPLSILIFFLTAVPFATNIARLAWDVVGVDIAPIGCVESTSISGVVYNKLLIATRTCVIAADLLVVLSTWWAMPGRSEGFPPHDTSRSIGLFGVIFRDGMIYFLVLFILNSLDMGLSLSTSNYLDFVGNSTSEFIDPITSILVSTFLLDLQEAHQRSCRVDSDDPLYSERSNSLVFARVIGSLGASIDPGMSASDDFEDEDDSDAVISDQREDHGVADEQDIVMTDEQDHTEV